MTYVYTDGGRVEAGLKTKTDCGIRAMAIACNISYIEARKVLKEVSKSGKLGSAAIARGIYKEDMEVALKRYGFVRKSSPKFKGRKARYSDLPKGRIVAHMAKHFAAVIDGTLYDSWDSSGKMVYDYWIKGGENSYV